MIKNILWGLFILLLGVIIGTTIGATAGGVGGGFIGACMYNEAALETKVISEDGSKKVARSFAQKIIKSEGQLQWVVENAEVEGDEGCDVFFKQMQEEIRLLEEADAKK